MKTNLWNKLYIRCVYAMKGKPQSQKRRIKRAWIKVMERRTGKNCFFQPW